MCQAYKDKQCVNFFIIFCHHDIVAFLKAGKNVFPSSREDLKSISQDSAMLSKGSKYEVRTSSCLFV